MQGNRRIRVFGQAIYVEEETIKGEEKESEPVKLPILLLKLLRINIRLSLGSNVESPICRRKNAVLKQARYDDVDKSSLCRIKMGKDEPYQCSKLNQRLPLGPGP